MLLLFVICDFEMICEADIFLLRNVRVNDCFGD
jgi:hypothetical protein